MTTVLLLPVLAALLAGPAAAEAEHAPALTCEQAARALRFALANHLDARALTPALDFRALALLDAELAGNPWLTRTGAAALDAQPRPAPGAAGAALLRGDCAAFEARAAPVRAALARARLQARDEATLAALAPPTPPDTPPRVERPLAGAAGVEAALRAAVVVRALRMRDAAPWPDAVRLAAHLVLEELDGAAAALRDGMPERALAAYVRALDPYSRWIPARAEVAPVERSFGLVLDSFGVVPQGLRIRVVVPGSPAARAGIAPGDVLLAVAGQALAGLTFAEAVAAYDRAADGSAIALGRISGRRLASRYQARLERTRLAAGQAVPTVHRRAVDGKDAVVVRLDVIEPGAAEAVAGLLARELAAAPPALVLLDLRGSPGGDLEAAAALAGLFLEGGSAGYVVRGDGTRRDLGDSGTRRVWAGPLAVAVSEETASSAELLAGALRARGRAILLGSRRTFGKGTVQEVFRDAVPGAPGALLLTDARYFLPDGTTPAGVGLAPDAVVEDPAARAGEPAEAPPEPGRRDDRWEEALLRRALAPRR